MKNKIEGWKLIKEYPGSDIKEMRQVIHGDVWVNGDNRFTTYQLLNKYSEFWEPIYEQDGIDLRVIINSFAYPGNPGYEQNHLYSYEQMRKVMVEACRQTLELVKKEIHKKRVANYNAINESDINNVLTMIK